MASERVQQRGAGPEGSGDEGADQAELQARLDWLLSDDDPWVDLEEEPPCFCTAYLVHTDPGAVRAQLTRTFPEIRVVHQSSTPLLIEFEWPEESFSWAEWLESPESFQGAGHIELGQGFVRIWTPTRSRMRAVVRSLLELERAGVTLRHLAVEHPLADMAGTLEETDEDLNPELDPEDLEFLLGFDGGEPDAWDDAPDLDDPWTGRRPSFPG